MVREKRKAKRNRRNKCILYVSIVGVVMIVAALISKSVWNHIREKDITVSEDGWVNVELKYLGSIKMRDLEIIGSAKPKHYKYSDGDLEYTLWLYKFWSDQKSFNKMQKHRDFMMQILIRRRPYNMMKGKSMFIVTDER